MTTRDSPTERLRAQAERMVRVLKRVERGEQVAGDNGISMAKARKLSTIKMGIAMDDGVRSLILSWTDIRDMHREQLVEFIVTKMRDQKPDA
jgi:hypothetical protein